jgi:hypothetical protein
MEWVSWQTSFQRFRSGRGDPFRSAESLLSMLNERLLGRENIALNAYTIADMLCFPWAMDWLALGNSDNFERLRRWLDRIWDRAAVKRAMVDPNLDRRVRPMPERTLRILHNARAFGGNGFSKFPPGTFQEAH